MIIRSKFSLNCKNKIVQIKPRPYELCLPLTRKGVNAIKIFFYTKMQKYQKIL